MIKELTTLKTRYENTQERYLRELEQSVKEHLDNALEMAFTPAQSIILLERINDLIDDAINPPARVAVQSQQDEIELGGF